MKTLKRIGYLLCLVLLLSIAIGLVTPLSVLAVPKTSSSLINPLTAEQAAVEQVTFKTKYPALSATAGSSYEFEIEVSYTGGEKPRVFDLRATVPSGFVSQITRSYGSGANIAAVQLDPTTAYPESLKVVVAPYYWLSPQPGDYKVTVEATSGTLKGSIDVTAVVTAKNELKLETPEGLLNTKVTVGKDNFFTYKVKNTGTAALDKINFSQSIRGGPSGWSVTFDPKSIDSLPVGADRDIQVNIKPPEKTIAGDYEINITARTEANNASDSLNIRITVLTPTVWGWVGVAVVVIVVIALIAMFWRLGRR
jgi:uncharacterized membrane protein